jgi:hypothetical protein
MVLFPEGLKALKEVAKEIGLDLRGAYLNLDGGFDSTRNRKCIFNAGLIPNINENPRNRKTTNSHSAPFFAVLKQFWQSLLKSGGDEFYTDNCLRFNSLFPCPLFFNHNFLQTGRPISGPLE